MKVNEIKLQIDVIPSEYRRKNQWKKRKLSLLLKSGHNVHLLHVDWNILNLENEYFKSDDTPTVRFWKMQVGSHTHFNYLYCLFKRSTYCTLQQLTFKRTVCKQINMSFSLYVTTKISRNAEKFCARSINYFCRSQLFRHF